MPSIAPRQDKATEMDVIDTATFQKLRDSTDADFARELVHTFLDDAPQLLADLRGALAGGDQAAFRRAAHTLKSNSTTFGASALADLARELEHAGLPAMRADGDASLSRVEEAYELVARALKELTHE
jgi:histidine phosphotransfer protein HptB